MDALLTLLALAFAGLGLAAPVLAILALVRSAKTERRLEGLEAQVRRLKREAGARATAAVPPLAEGPPTGPTPAAPPPVTSPPAEPRPQRPTTTVAQAHADAAARAHEAAAGLERSKPVPAPRPRIEWERWVGVRGAAVLGGVAAALAGLLLFQHALQEGWITDPLRVVLGIAAGLALIVGGELLRPRRYRFAPEAMEGAGIVVLYAAFWAGSEKYSMWPQIGSWIAMVVVTACACLLAYRNRSQIIAVLGLAGGFGTPLLLASVEDRPFGLFGYVLLLDLGLLLLGRRRRWPLLGLLGLAGTGAWQALWVITNFDAHEHAFALVMLGAFALVFAAAGSGVKGVERSRWAIAQGLSALFPFLFALYFATRADIGPHVWPTALLAALLTAASCLLRREPGLAALPTGAAAGSVGLVLTWLLAQVPTGAAVWELAGVAVGLALVPLGFAELAARRSGAAEAEGPRPDQAVARAAAVLACGLMGVLAVASVLSGGVDLLPRAVGLGVLAIFVARVATRTGWFPLPLVSASACAAGVVVHLLWHHPTASAGVGPAAACAALLAFPILLHALALWPRDELGRVFAAGAAGWFSVPVLLTIGWMAALEAWPPAGRLAVAIALSISLVLAAARTGIGAVVATLGLCAWIALLEVAKVSDVGADSANQVIGGGFALTVLVALAPLATARLSRSLVACWGAAVALLLFPWALREHAGLLLGRGAELLAFLPIAALAAGAAWSGGKRSVEARAALGLAAIVLASFAVAFEVDVEPIVVASGLTAGGLALFWVRVDRTLLAGVALLFCLLATAGLAVRALSSGHYALPQRAVLNGIAWAHLVPAAGAIALEAVLSRFESQRVRLGGGRLIGAATAGGCAAVTLFLWLSMVVLELFETGPRIELPGAVDQAAHLTLSLTWIGYALVLLGLGMARKRTGPRWASLVVLLLAIAKVFLHDLGDLEGLTRVASLAGLAFSLLLVSLLYQRFVFGRVAAAE